ncbi:MAG: GGDEF domain-containing protein [Mesorhizobium sp.]|nr:GGDEF domain-containing protein [Mesorhizobium sp.]MBN9242580.1 GGDEF domain-containing protein [Mesorhizobium sp.]MBN9275581.1 GGDEF domain-containing protein [Mesorhizobium sp.]
MSGGNFILGINLFVAGLLAAVFMGVAAYDGRRLAARWLAGAYLLGMGYYAVELSIPSFRDAIPAVVMAFFVFLAATVAFNAGLAAKYAVRMPWVSSLIFVAASTVVVAFAQDLPRQSLLRMMAYQLPYAVMQAVGFGIVWAARGRRDHLDRMLTAVLAASTAQFLGKPFIAAALGGWGADPQAYSGTAYALVSQSLGTVFAMALALLMLVILVRDALGEAAARSETDALSGLLNRGGFERQAGAMLLHAAGQGRPIALVLADLDHFKAINDTFGHACGDRVIQSFAVLLREAGMRGAVAGRIGGEEFAVLLPGANLVAGRLFAEGARSAFGTLPIDPLPAERRCTASFGVAELLPAESFWDLMRRADEALYGAKKAGRDQVRASSGPIGLPTAAPLRGFSGRG